MILGVTGHARHGKDSVAAILVQQYGFRRIGLADPLKAACHAIFGWSAVYTDGPLKEAIDPAWGISPRRAMQLLGTEFGQFELSKHQDFASVTGRCLWARRAMMAARESGDVVIPDVRFHHEEEAIRAEGGRILRVVRPSVQVCREHASESEMDSIKVDAEIVNDGTLADLAERVRAFMEAG